MSGRATKARLDRESAAAELRRRRRDLAEARARLAARKRRLRAACKRYRKSARLRVRAWYREQLEQLRAERARRYAAISARCAERLAGLRERRDVEQAERKLETFRHMRAALLEVRGGAKTERAAVRRELAHRARESRLEDDDRVRYEVEQHDRALLPVWERMRARIKATPRKSRAEAFFEWVEENPGEAIAIQAAAGEREAAKVWNDLAAMREAHEKAEREHEIERLTIKEGNSMMAAYLRIYRGPKEIGRVAYDRGTFAIEDWLRRPSDEDLPLATEAARRHLRRIKQEVAEVPF